MMCLSAVLALPVLHSGTNSGAFQSSMDGVYTAQTATPPPVQSVAPSKAGLDPCFDCKMVILSPFNGDPHMAVRVPFPADPHMPIVPGKLITPAKPPASVPVSENPSGR
jgi:hypothetical protein